MQRVAFGVDQFAGLFEMRCRAGAIPLAILQDCQHGVRDLVLWI